MPKLPSWATIALSLTAGVLAILNQTAFQVGSHWYAAITVALVFLSGIGISPLLGDRFRNTLHLSHAATVVISAGLGALTLALTIADLSQPVKAAIAFVLTVLAGLGFGPNQPAAPAAPAAA